MSIGLVIIEKTYLGETWQNTHAFDTGQVGGLQDADLEATGFTDVLVGTEAALGGAGYAPSTAKIIPALIAFERQMTFAPISFTKVYVTDGKLSDLLDPNTFAVAATNLPGLLTMDAAGASPDNIVPGNIALQINRVPATFSARQGRMQLRAALGDADVRFANRGGVSFTNNTIAAAYVARLSTALASSGLSRFFGQIPDGIHYAIPHYAATGNLLGQRAGALTGATAIGGLTIIGPVSRQMKRGKKKVAA